MKYLPFEIGRDKVRSCRMECAVVNVRRMAGEFPFQFAIGGRPETHAMIVPGTCNSPSARADRYRAHPPLMCQLSPLCYRLLRGARPTLHLAVIRTGKNRFAVRR